MKIFFIFFLLISNLYAKFDMNTGLWEQTAKVLIDGEDYNQKIDSMLKSIPAAQRAMMQNMMKNSGTNIDNWATQTICITTEMLNDPKKIAESNKKCNTKILKESSTSIEMEMDCKNEFKGKSTMQAVNKEKYTGKLDGVTKDNKKINVSFTGIFKASKCNQNK